MSPFQLLSIRARFVMASAVAAVIAPIGVHAPWASADVTVVQVRGTVVDSTGKPFPGAWLMLKGESETRTRSAKDGTFQLAIASSPRGGTATATLQVQWSRGKNQWVGVVSERLSLAQNIDLGTVAPPPTRDITYRISDLEGRGIGGIRANVYAEPGSNGWMDGGYALSPSLKASSAYFGSRTASDDSGLLLLTTPRLHLPAHRICYTSATQTACSELPAVAASTDDTRISMTLPLLAPPSAPLRVKTKKTKAGIIVSWSPPVNLLASDIADYRAELIPAGDGKNHTFNCTVRSTTSCLIEMPPKGSSYAPVVWATVSGRKGIGGTGRSISL